MDLDREFERSPCRSEQILHLKAMIGIHSRGRTDMILLRRDKASGLDANSLARLYIKLKDENRQ